MVEVTLNGDDRLLKEAQIRWTFGQDFIKELLARYDTNKNGTLDQTELIRVEKILLNYLAKKNYLTSIEYVLAQESAEKIDIKAHHASFIQTDDTLIFTYVVPLNLSLIHI